MRLATFNLENLDRDGSRPEAFAARVTALKPAIQALAADVLCLQEVNARKGAGRRSRSLMGLDALLAETSFASFHRAHSSRPGADDLADVHNLVILSRWPILEQCQVFHDFVPVESWTLSSRGGLSLPIRLAWDRPLLYVAIARPSAPTLHVLNLHLRAPRASFIAGAKSDGIWHSSAGWAEGYYLAARKRHGQALEARLFVERLFDIDPNAEIAVCGDLNADAYETPTRLIEALPEDVESLEFSSRSLEPLERRVQTEDRHTVIHDGRRILLDHILASPRLAARCTRVQILNRGLEDEAHACGEIAGSLHAPVVAEFRD